MSVSDHARTAFSRSRATARTALFVPEIDKLVLAVRATALTPASVWVFSPVP
jgi:hypothetical protein